MPRMPRRTLLAAALAAPRLARPAAPDAAWPDRPIRIIVTFPAGTQTDILTRLYAAPLAERLGQPVIIDNRGGGQGQIGIRPALAAPPEELCWNLGDAVIKRRSVLACC